LVHLIILHLPSHLLDSKAAFSEA